MDYSKNLRRIFADEIYLKMSQNKNIWLVVGDLGYGVWDKVRDDFHNRFINVGVAEHCMMSVGVGLALEGKIPLVYSITSFLLFRPFEVIRNYINREKIPVKLIGSGRDRDYLHDGFSHWAEEDKRVMKLIFKNIKSYWPRTGDQLKKYIDQMLEDESPYYINLKR